jgi:hypothetical protein
LRACREIHETAGGARDGEVADSTAEELFAGEGALVGREWGHAAGAGGGEAHEELREIGLAGASTRSGEPATP